MFSVVTKNVFKKFIKLFN